MIKATGPARRSRAPSTSAERRLRAALLDVIIELGTQQVHGLGECARLRQRSGSFPAATAPGRHQGEISAGYRPELPGLKVAKTCRTGTECFANRNRECWLATTAIAVRK